MYVTVRFFNGFSELLTYKVPADWSFKLAQGAVVTVPLRNRLEPACIETIFEKLPPNTVYTIKEIQAYHGPLNDPLYQKFIGSVSSYYALEPLVLYRRLASFLREKGKEYTLPPQALSRDPNAGPTLTAEQVSAVEAVAPLLDVPRHQTFMLHGVTGSGKTIVYQTLIQRAYELKKSTILLLPEVSLAVQFMHIFKAFFGEEFPLFSFHSATGAREKKMLWHALKNKQPVLVIGVHQPVLLPLTDVGLIIVDEEHESGYQEKKHPKINSKEAALLRAQLYNIPILLGSATPSITSLHNVYERDWKLLTIHQRFAGAFPSIKVVKLDSVVRRASFWISKELEQALSERLSTREQSLIFINRRGYSFFIQCVGCGFIMRCPHCSVSLTLHQDDLLRCHYCDFRQRVPTTCTACSSKEFLKKGIGTQQVVGILERLFPTARIGRADLDATVNRSRWQKTMEAFHNRELDILVGTQTITKGYHFPHVTLVGILWADMQLGIPAYNAAETTLQQLIQVAGRAGRYHPKSLVIAQTMMEHPLWSYLNEIRYLDFYEYEKTRRAEVEYPPFIRFAEIEMRHSDESVVQAESLTAADILDTIIAAMKSKIKVLGPAQPLVHKIQDIHIRKLYLKGATIKEVLRVYAQFKRHSFQSYHFFTPNPLTM